MTDSSKSITTSPAIQYWEERDFSLSAPSYTSIDTSLDGVQKYFLNNFPYGLGLANRKLLFESSSDIGFQSGFDFLNLFGYQKDEIKYYHTRTPFTEVNVVFWMKKEQFSRLLHTQNITKQWNISLNMLRIRSDGFYLKQNCSDNNISLSTNYTSKNNHYSLLANGIVSSIKTEENGGVTNDLYFEENLLVDKKLLPVKLPDAKTKRGGREVYVKQSLYFGEKENKMKGDSIISSRMLPKHSLSYSINAKDNWFMYSENSPDYGYYENIYFDSIKTHDSTHIFTLQNSVSWKSTLSRAITAELSFDQKRSHLIQYKTNSILATDAQIKDNIIHIEISKTRSEKQSYWRFGGNYIPQENRQNEYRFYLDLSDYLTWKGSGKKDNIFSLQYEIYSHSTPFLFSSYSSNHFLWRNSFNNTSGINGKASYRNLKYDFIIGIESKQVSGYVYFDSTFSPRQFNDTVFISSMLLQKNFHLKHFHFNNKIIWQHASKNVIHLPQFVSNHSLYYEDKWFHKVMNVQIGFDVSFYTSYYADAYMPALGLYYFQNENKIGNYPFIDFFLNMKVKRANIFFKSEHLNSGLMGTYYLAPHMPAPDRSFKIGVRWMFYD